MADQESIDAQDRQATAFGVWLARARGAQGLTQNQAADRAGVSRVQWARWEAGSGRPKRSNIPAVARAVRHPNEAEVYSRAGYFPPDGDVTEVVPVEEESSDVDGAALQAFFEGLPRQLQQEEYERIKRLWLEHRRDQTDFGKKAE